MIAVAASLFVAGCAEKPFFTGNPNIQAPDGVQVVSVCYHANVTTREEVLSLAAKECEVEGRASSFGIMTRCLTPVRYWRKLELVFSAYRQNERGALSAPRFLIVNVRV